MISGHEQLAAFLRDDAERRLVKGINCPACTKATAVIIGIMAVLGLLATAGTAIMLWGTAR